MIVRFDFWFSDFIRYLNFNLLVDRSQLPVEWHVVKRVLVTAVQINIIIVFSIYPTIQMTNI